MNISFLLVGIGLLSVFNLIQAQPAACSARLVQQENALVGCLATPLALFRLSGYVNVTVPKYSQFICPSMKISLQCIRHTLWTADKLGVCTLDSIYNHTMMMMGGIYGQQSWWGDHAVGVLSTCQDEFVYQDGCDNPSNVLDFRTAIVANCAWSIMDLMQYGPDFTRLHCMNVAYCSNLVKAGYSTIVSCDENQVSQVFDSVTTNPMQLQELYNLTGFNMMMCPSYDQDCLFGSSPFWGGMVECLATPLGVLQSSDVINYNTAVGARRSCSAYLSAIICIKGRYDRFMQLEECGLAAVYHPLFLNYLQYMANKEGNVELTAEVFNTSVCRSEVVNVVPACPDKEQIQTAVVVFCAEPVYRAPADFKCTALNSCRQTLIDTYREQAGECDTDSLFSFIERDADLLNEFSTFAGFNITECDRVITTPAPTVKPSAISCRNVSQVFAEITGGSAYSCVMTFTSVLTAQTNEIFCEHLWEGLRCAAYKISNDGMACFNDMKREIQARPNEIYDTMARALGENLISGISDRIRNAYTCPQARIMRPPRPTVPVYLRQCDQLGETMLNAVKSCINTSFNSTNPPECMRFGRATRCIANKLITVGTTERKTKLFEHMVEQCIELMVDVMEFNIDQLSSKLGSLHPRECMKIAKVCGESLWPLNRTCNGSCPTNFTCEDGKYCCPMKRPGMCPKMNEKRLCSRIFGCDVDMDCHHGQKCCDQGCGFKTCADIERRQKSACEMRFESFKERILPQRACGDGTGSVHVPQCQNDKFGPIQGDYASGVLHCVTEDGRKIYGSEFRGNKDCPKTRPGKCPPMPSRCMTTPMDEIIGAGRTDMYCSTGQKMCHVDEQNVCQMKCVNVSGTTEDTPFEVCPTGVERSCCPADMVVGKVCVGRPSAVPRINPCEGCHIEFYDEHNNKVNCSEGVSECVHKRAMARMMNRDMTKNYSVNFLNFIKSRELFSEGMMDDMDMDLEDMRLDFDMDMMQSMKEKYEKMVQEMDEYGAMARKFEQMENDERTLEIGTYLVRTISYLANMATAMCKYFDQHNICQNKGVCVIGSEQTEYLKICKCADGYHGLFCEISGDPSPATPCMRYKAVVDGIWARVYDNDMHGELVHRLLTLFRVNYNLMPKISCTQDGMNYARIQHGAMLPYSPTNPMVRYCVDPTTGLRIPNTLIAMGSETLNCDIITKRDVLDLPNGCRLQPGDPCEDGGPCQYFYNSTSQMCVPSSRMGRGQKTLSQCYMECGFEVKLGCPPLDPDAVGICPTCPDEGCGIGEGCCPSECGGTRCRDLTYQVFLPKPCEALGCDWASEFCLVDDAGNGTCKPMKTYCMQNKAEGFGNKNIGAYYFNPTIRRCDKFTYKGFGGNTNRFYSLHQCQLECGVYADYKYDFPVCPPPMMLTRIESDGTMMKMCDSDHHCGENHVCCSDGMQGVCTEPIRVCGTTRCSPFAKCENDTCICPTCDGEMMNEVCGDNGHRFDNLCMLKKYACEKMMNITAQPCPTSSVNPPSMCPMACTLEYMPICTIEIKEDGNHVTETSPNACALRAKKMCENRNIHPLYMGKCEQECNGVTCQPFETCINGQCACPMCSTELSPVCARPLSVLSVESEKMTFPSICEMRRYGCQEAKDRMVIAAHEPCEKIDPEYECPGTKMDIVRSAESLCDTETNSYCSVGHKCCSYGAGTKCIPMKYLKRKMVTRPGFCPVLSYVNYNRNDCHKKEIMCEDDADVPPNMKCCDNMVCGHKTIAAAIGITRDSICGNGKMAIPSFTCNPDGKNHACPMDATCTNVNTSEGYSIGVCCKTADNSDPMRDMMEVYGNKLCNAVERLGLEMICSNNGRCVGDVHRGQMCHCPEGYFGTFCEKMVETPLCDRMSTMYSTVFGLVHQAEGADKVSRKRRDGHGGGGDEDGMGQTLNMFDYLVNPTLMALPAIMKGMGFEYLPHDGEVQCENGSFARAQCFESLDEGMDMCACVNPMTGIRIKNGPVAEKAEDLDCNFVSNPDFPEFCKETPSNASCSGDETEMWYFCPMQGECVKYMDRGCNSNHKNSFPTMALCNAKCGAESATPLGCANVRCPGGTVCTRVQGQIQCLDVTKVDVIHEYPEPDCEENGDYSPMQCQGNTCHCVTKNGEVLANTFGMAQTLKCYRDSDGNTLAEIPEGPQAKRCEDSNAMLVVCESQGDPCNNCQMPDNMGDGNNMNSGNMNSGNMMGGNMGGNMRDSKVDENGTCISCETCPSGQGRQACTNTCDSAPVCKQFPKAMCKVDKCTCEVKYYKSGNQMVNCEAAQSQCEKAKMALEQENATRNLQMRAMGAMGVNSFDELRCSAKGAFYAICTTGMQRRCFCLNATDGMRMGPGLNSVNINSLDCTNAQLRTIAKRFRATVKISDIPLEDIPVLDRNTIVAYFRSLIERKFPNVKIIVMRLISGSTNIYYELEIDETVDVSGGTTDVASTADAIHTEIMGESVTVGENVFIASEATVIEFLTAEDLPATTPIPVEDDEDNTGLIIGCVVGGVALLLIIVAVIVICNRNKNSKSSSMQFSDLQGKDNPIYPYKA